MVKFGSALPVGRERNIIRVKHEREVFKTSHFLIAKSKTNLMVKLC